MAQAKKVMNKIPAGQKNIGKKIPDVQAKPQSKPPTAKAAAKLMGAMMVGRCRGRKR